MNDQLCMQYIWIEYIFQMYGIHVSKLSNTCSYVYEHVYRLHICYNIPVKV